MSLCFVHCGNSGGCCGKAAGFGFDFNLRSNIFTNMGRSGTDPLGDNSMDRDNSNHQSGQVLQLDGLKLPSLPNPMETSLLGVETFPVDGTNVIRVPFGIRQARRQRPERPERWATLVLPLQPVDSPNPPPQAA